MRDFSEAMRETAQEWGPDVPEEVRQKLDEDFVTGDVARGAGSSLGFMAPSGIVGGVGKLAGLSERALARLATASVATSGAAASGNSFRREAEQALQESLENGEINEGEYARSVGMAELFGTAVGTTEALPLSNMVKRVGQLPGGESWLRNFLTVAGRGGAARAAQWVRGAGGRALVDALAEAGEEAGQELFQAVSQDLYASQTFDPEREVGAGAARGAGVGGVTGAVMSILASALGARHGRRPPPGITERTDGMPDGPEGDIGATAEPPPGTDEWYSREQERARAPITGGPMPAAVNAEPVAVDDDLRSFLPEFSELPAPSPRQVAPVAQDVSPTELPELTNTPIPSEPEPVTEEPAAGGEEAALTEEEEPQFPLKPHPKGGYADQLGRRVAFDSASNRFRLLPQGRSEEDRVAHTDEEEELMDEETRQVAIESVQRAIAELEKRIARFASRPASQRLSRLRAKLAELTGEPQESLPQGRSEVDRQSHTLEDAGSTPAPAPNIEPGDDVILPDGRRGRVRGIDPEDEQVAHVAVDGKIEEVPLESLKEYENMREELDDSQDRAQAMPEELAQVEPTASQEEPELAISANETAVDPETLEANARKSNNLERIARGTSSPEVLRDVLRNADGIVNESRIVNEVANNPNADDETFEQAINNPKARAMAPDSYFENLRKRRAEREFIQAPPAAPAPTSRPTARKLRVRDNQAQTMVQVDITHAESGHKFKMEMPAGKAEKILHDHLSTLELIARCLQGGVR